jgi:hypothetical protein
MQPQIGQLKSNLQNSLPPNQWLAVDLNSDDIAWCFVSTTATRVEHEKKTTRSNAEYAKSSDGK